MKERDNVESVNEQKAVTTSDLCLPETSNDADETRPFCDVCIFLPDPCWDCLERLAFEVERDEEADDECEVDEWAEGDDGTDRALRRAEG